ncbi:peptide chain release factor aRF-1 [Candidatus Pacearchaeota archaeon]|nr:peptide chain release factor aRF-1 [Candidatus Pacearchaeota archaeon]
MEQDLEEFISRLKGIRGRHTELITVYIPAGFNKDAVVKQLEAEKSTADNIKSKGTRKAVMTALEKITRHLKTIDKMPENGLAVFCGNVSKTEGQEDIQLWSIEPPYPMKTRLYRCDQEFVIEPLEEMTQAKEVYGLVVMDRKEATIGLLEGKHISVLRKMTSGVPGKIRAGGQSSARFERSIEGMAKEFYRRIAEAMKECFFENKKLKGILIGGPIPTKEEFMKEGELVTALKDKVLGLRDLGNTDESGLGELVELSSDVLAQQGIIHEKKIMERFFYMLAKEPGKTAYGADAVRKALDYGAVELLLVSKPMKEKAIKLIEDAERTSAKIEIISVETDEGKQFYNLAGIGAILRFAIG